MVESPSQPLLYTLPEDLETVQEMAIALGLNVGFTCASCACACRQKAQGQHLSFKLGGLQVLGAEYVRIYLQAEYQGRRGTNNEALFRATFAELIPRVYLAFLAFLQATPQALALLVSLFHEVPFDAPRCMAYFLLVARHYYASATTSDTPLTFSWPLLPSGPAKGGA